MSIVSANSDPEPPRRTRIARETARHLVMTLIDGIDDPERALAACARHDVEGYWFPAAARAVGRIRSGTIDKHVLALAMERDAEPTAEFICLMCLLTGHDAIPGDVLDTVYRTQVAGGNGSAHTARHVDEPLLISPLARFLWIAAAKGHLTDVDAHAVMIRLKSLTKTALADNRTDMQDCLAKTLPASAASDNDFDPDDDKQVAIAWTRWAWSISDADGGSSAGELTRQPADSTLANADLALAWKLLDQLMVAPAPSETNSSDGTSSRCEGTRLAELLIRDASGTDAGLEHFAAPLLADDLRVLVNRTAERIRSQPRTATVKDRMTRVIVRLDDDPTPALDQAVKSIATRPIHKKPLVSYLLGLLTGGAFLVSGIVATFYEPPERPYDADPLSPPTDSPNTTLIIIIAVIGVIVLTWNLIRIWIEFSRRAHQRERFRREADCFRTEVLTAHAELIERAQRAEVHAEAIARLGRDLDVALARVEERAQQSDPMKPALTHQPT